MSATNSTTHYSLPSFLGSDKPSWLVDWNGAMATIDSAIYEAKQAADTAAASATAVASDLATLSGTVSTQGSTISTLSDTLTTAVGNINIINGNITTINSLIGNGTPTTTDQTLIGAINEINAKAENLIPCFNGKTLLTSVGPSRNASYTATVDCLAMVSYGHVNDSQLGAWASINSIDNIYQAALTSTGGTTSAPSYDYTFVVALKAGDTVSVRDNSGIYGLIKVFS